MQPVTRVQPLPRVHKTPHNHYHSMTHLLAASTPSHVPNVQPRAPTMTPQAPTQVIKVASPRLRPRQRHTTPHIASTPPSRNTLSKVATPYAGPPSRNIRSKSSNSYKPLQPLTEQMYALEYEVHQAMAIMDNYSGNSLSYRHLLRHPRYKNKWGISSENEFGRFSNGVGGRIKNPNNAIRFLHKTYVPKKRMKDVTYGQLVCTVPPEKSDKNRTLFAVGGNRINYPSKVATPTADMMVDEIFFNSVVSTRGARFMTIEISNS